MLSGAEELLAVTNSPGMSEVGGGHGAKGVDFQRWWAVLRLIELEKDNATDYALLFEAVQDVTELDSSKSPKRARIYQIKKKDRLEWTWNSLTNISEPAKPHPVTGKVRRKTFALDKFGESIIGKLHSGLAAFSTLDVYAEFVSNQGCDLVLLGGGKAATTVGCTLAHLDEPLADLLKSAATMLAQGSTPPDAGRIQLTKCAIHPDDLCSPATAMALQLLNARSPSHAGQAQSFVEALYVALSALGRKTDLCPTYEILLAERGFTKAQFLAAISKLEQVPDIPTVLNCWIIQLSREGMNFMQTTQLRLKATEVLTLQLGCQTSESGRRIDDHCDTWLSRNAPGHDLLPYFQSALADLKGRFTEPDAELLARFALRAIKKCADPTFDASFGR